MLHPELHPHAHTCPLCQHGSKKTRRTGPFTSFLTTPAERLKAYFRVLNWSF